MKWRMIMRKPRDFDAELKALSDKAQQLQQRRIQQLGTLVITTGAAALPIDSLAGALLQAATSKSDAREAWSIEGATFFRTSRSGAGSGVPTGNTRPAATNDATAAGSGKGA
jgi:DNA-binding protein H-NS